MANPAFFKAIVTAVKKIPPEVWMTIAAAGADIAKGRWGKSPAQPVDVKKDAPKHSISIEALESRLNQINQNVSGVVAEVEALRGGHTELAGVTEILAARIKVVTAIAVTASVIALISLVVAIMR